MREFSQLSIEQKAEAYDEAIARANELLYVSDKDSLQYYTICHILPELEEVEGERIRQELTEFLKSASGGFLDTTIRCKTFGKWLTWLEEQGEQKPADKVEPKFKVGDWIIGKATNNEPRQISEITDQCYKSTYGGQYGFSFEDELHLWSIKDAKDGDVLQLGKITAIFQDYISDKECRCYCSVFEGEFKIPIQYADTYGCHNAIPATKEQRDKLEKAMADAGYAFDFEKKELKKIDDEIEIPFGSKDSELIAESYYIPKGFHAEIDDDKVVIKKGEKPTWSEMDKAITRAISSNLELLKNRGSGEVSEAAYQSEIKWLKALKRRVDYDEEWSEEDKTALGDALWCCKQAASIAKNENDMGNIWYAEKWLKSLEGRIHPKNDYNPYKEVVESIAKMCKRYDKYSYSILKDFYDNVKVKCKDAKEFDSLHPQNTKAISQ